MINLDFGNNFELIWKLFFIINLKNHNIKLEPFLHPFFSIHIFKFKTKPNWQHIKVEQPICIKRINKWLKRMPQAQKMEN